ncbi:MAG: CAP domain-containing protein [Solirubrobacteraceae bacterium]
MKRFCPLLITALTLLACASLPAGAAAARRAHDSCSASAGGSRRHQRKHPRACRHALRRARVKGIRTRHTSPRPSHTSPRPSHTSPRPSATSSTAATSAATASDSAAASAAAIAAALSTPCENTQLTPEAGDVELIRAAVLCLINRERAEHAESPLKLSSKLEAAAEAHTDELVSADYFAHVSPTGETPVDRIRETGYIPSPEEGYVIGENLAWGTFDLSTPQAIVNAWIASPGHLANILEGQYTETGIGITPAVPPSLAEGAPGATYAQEFGVIIE